MYICIYIYIYNQSLILLRGRSRRRRKDSRGFITTHKQTNKWEWTELNWSGRRRGKKKQEKKNQGTSQSQYETKHNITIIIIIQIFTIHYQHTNRSLPNNIPHPKCNTNTQIHHFKTTFMCPRSIAGVPSSQALPVFLITAHHLRAFLLSR